MLNLKICHSSFKLLNGAMYLQVNLNLEKMNQALEAFTCVFALLFYWNILQKTVKALMHFVLPN